MDRAADLSDGGLLEGSFTLLVCKASHYWEFNNQHSPRVAAADSKDTFLQLLICAITIQAEREVVHRVSQFWTFSL